MSTDPSLPLAGSQNGSLFGDRSDPALTWFLSAYVPQDPSPSFGFAASEGLTVDPSGNPLDTAIVTITLVATDPPDVAAARQANPQARLQAIPAIAYTPSLLLPYTDQQGNNLTATVAGGAAQQSDGSIVVTIAALLGATVLQAYRELSDLGGAVVQLDWTFHVWQRLLFPIRREPPLLPLRPMPPPVAVTADTAALPVLPVRPFPIHRLPQPLPVPILPFPIHPFPLPPEGIWLVGTQSTSTSAALETVYAAPGYKPRYTITPHGGTPRTIIDASDLVDFNTPHSEYRQFTSLGDVPTRYPSVAGLYLGQVSGTLVVLPVAYGIVVGKGGCMARIDAVVDTSPTSFSGCRFQLTFELAPVVDPVDLASLTADLVTDPEAAGRSLSVVLPSGLDARITPSFSAPVSNLVYAQAPDPTHLLMSFEITDTGTTPALVNVNLLLAQLTSATTLALFGTIGVRLDDVYSPPLRSTVVLALRVTASTDDLAVSAGASPDTVTVTNQSPDSLTLVRARLQTAGGSQTTLLGEPLPAGQNATLTTTDASAISGIAVSRELTVANPFPRSALTQFVALHVETVQQATHTLTINATAVDFAAESIDELDIQISLDALPSVSVPLVTLRPDHRIDSVNVVVPIDAALTGLAATLTVTMHASAGGADRDAEASTDFAEDPIYVLTPAVIAPPQPVT